MPNMHAGKSHNLVPNVHQTKAKILFLTSITSWNRFVNTNRPNGSQTQEMATAYEHRGRSWRDSRYWIRAIRRQNIKGDGGDVRISFQDINCYRNLIALNKPRIVIKAAVTGCIRFPH